jgi:lysozyme family protein
VIRGAAIFACGLVAAFAAAVTALQKDLGVDADGRFGPETADAFNKVVADGTITPK